MSNDFVWDHLVTLPPPGVRSPPLPAGLDLWFALGSQARTRPEKFRRTRTSRPSSRPGRRWHQPPPPGGAGGPGASRGREVELAVRQQRLAHAAAGRKTRLRRVSLPHLLGSVPGSWELLSVLGDLGATSLHTFLSGRGDAGPGPAPLREVPCPRGALGHRWRVTPCNSPLQALASSLVHHATTGAKLYPGKRAGSCLLRGFSSVGQNRVL